MIVKDIVEEITRQIDQPDMSRYDLTIYLGPFEYALLSTFFAKAEMDIEKITYKGASMVRHDQSGVHVKSDVLMMGTNAALSATTGAVAYKYYTSLLDMSVSVL